jgi:carbonic anhydrase
MSCSNATAPIDINTSNVVGKCDFKCEYSFHYNDSSCIATNRGDYISISYDKSSSPPVTYNSSAYDVKEIRIYSLSLHSYMGQKTDGEIIIVHESASGAYPLLVCVPIKISNTGTPGSQYLTNIVNTVSQNAPADGEQTTVNISRFNLNAVVPRKPFFSYTATEPYQPCSTSKHEYIVFKTSDGSIGITQDTLKKLQSIISVNAYDVKSGPGLFYNEKGPINADRDGQIYIDCQPVGQSEEEEIIVTDTGSSSFSFSTGDIMNNKYFQMFLGSLIFVGIIYLINMGLESYSVKKGGANSVSSAANDMTSSLRTTMGGRRY